ncbi:class I SAM-dependent methyltransferase [Salinibacillus xinjiangensis]|uniref:Methyltransferase domain-containing protein n=1 Tax=Salinibacillus xinjiangensis TaxID=1229268 RepID=A0A6G1X3P0_9BACI|nr:methyltransferase domain-containing protein [Salinibacillus xinjiangensis]MRG85613.1 methyltransferase domain-containing protein [Salinibacillus xinjiangensis]
MSEKRFDPKKAHKLVDPIREEIVPPQKILELLSLSGDEKIIDLGAGNGFLTLPLAEATSERVMAVDVEDGMLGMLDDRAKEQNIRNIDRMKSQIEILKFPDASFQRAVAAFVLHEVDGIERTLREIKRILTTNGQLLVLDWEEVESDEGPPLDHRIHSERMEKLVENEGFEVEKGHLNGDIYYISAKVG